MTDPITIIILAFQAVFAPDPAVTVPATIVVSPAPEAVSWAPPESWSLPVEETAPVVKPAKLSCKLERKGSNFVAVIVADAAYSVDYELMLQSKGSNTLKVKRTDVFEVAPGSNRLDLNANLKIGKQKITGELTLHGKDGSDATCAVK